MKTSKTYENFKGFMKTSKSYENIKIGVFYENFKNL